MNPDNAAYVAKIKALEKENARLRLLIEEQKSALQWAGNHSGANPRIEMSTSILEPSSAQPPVAMLLKQTSRHSMRQPKSCRCWPTET